MKILIIEDEILAAQRLQNLLQQINPEHHIIDVLDSVKAAVLWFKQHPSPDLILLDIQLADGLSFSIFEQVPVNAPVIFITAFDEYAIKSFELNSIDYLLKPVEQQRLQTAIQKFESIKKYFSQQELQEKIFSVLQNINSIPKSYKSKFLVNKGENLFSLNTTQIAYFKAEDKTVALFTLQNERFFINFSLEQVEEQLNPEHFFRINRQYIIALHAIQKIQQHFNYKLKVFIEPTPEEDLFVSKQKTTEFKNWLNQ